MSNGMKIVQFDPNGERLNVTVVFGYANVASYRLRLWESVTNAILLDKSGNNQNPEDDSYNLPLPTNCNDGRIVQCETSIISPNPNPGDKYSVDLVFRQGKTEIGKIGESGDLSGTGAKPEIWAKLVAA